MLRTFLCVLSFRVLVVATLSVRLAWAQAAPASPPQALPSQVWTWEQVKDRLELNNPTLLAGKLNISELQAQEITAHLRPNPQLTLLADQIDPFPDNHGQSWPLVVAVSPDGRRFAVGYPGGATGVGYVSLYSTGTWRRCLGSTEITSNGMPCCSSSASPSATDGRSSQSGSG